MDTRIEFLEQLEADLEVAAEFEAKRAASRASSPRSSRPPRRGLLAAVGVAASLLVLAWGIGWVATNGPSPTSGESRAAVPAGGAPSATPASAPGPEKAGSRLGDWSFSVDTHEGVPTTPPHDQPSGEHDLSKIIRDGSVSLVIDDGTFAQTFGRVSVIADRLGGFVLSQTTSNGDSGTLTLRIPADRFDRAVAATSRLGDVESSKIEGQDVTAEYVDLTARLTILRARRTSLLGLLDQATTLTDSLRLSDRIDQVQTEIERIQGRKRFLDNQVAQSTLTVTMREKSTPVAQEEPQPKEIENPSLGRAWDRAVQGFFGVLATVVAGLGYLVPIGILVLIGYGVWLWVRRRRDAVAD